MDQTKIEAHNFELEKILKFLYWMNNIIIFRKIEKKSL